jgi:hypothetical protein
MSTLTMIVNATESSSDMTKQPGAQPITRTRPPRRRRLAPPKITG